MIKRHETASQKVDAEIFKRTASTTKKVNVQPSNMRGGIRL